MFYKHPIPYKFLRYPSNFDAQAHCTTMHRLETSLSAIFANLAHDINTLFSDINLLMKPSSSGYTQTVHIIMCPKRYVQSDNVYRCIIP